MAELTDQELEAKWAGADTVITGANPPPLSLNSIPLTTSALSNSNRNAPPALDEEAIALAKLGKQTGIPFHRGLPTVQDIELKSISLPNDQMEFLVKKYGAENIRMNELGEPVVRQNGEDYVVDPHSYTLNSLSGLLAYAPETLLSAVALKAGGPEAGLVKQALYGALGAAVGRAGKEVGVRGAEGMPINYDQIANQAASQVPQDVAGGLLLGGGVKAGQMTYDLLQGRGLPNPLVNMRFFKPLLSPANPELTQEGVAAAQRLAAKTGIPANLSPAEATGIPLLAQLETRQENVAAGAGPAIKAQIARDQVTRDWQNWFIRPETLATDEAVARRGLGALQSNVDPLEADVGLAKFALEAQRRGDTRLIESMRAQGEAATQAKIINDFQVGDIPRGGAPMTETGDLLRTRVLNMRDAEDEALGNRYEAFFSHPETMQPVIKPEGLKQAIDTTLAELPGVTKTVEKPTGVLNARGEMETRSVTEKVPIATPVRPRLEELSAKLANGRVAINDLKQVRTDVGNAIKEGKALTGVEPGRLKQLYGQLSRSIEDGLDEVGNPALKSEWETLTGDYQKFADKFSERTLAPLFKEADQPGIGNTDFAKSIIGSADKYNALKSFLGDNASELQAFHKTVRGNILEKSLADGSSSALDGPTLIKQLEKLQTDNPALFKDAFGNNGRQFVKAARVLSSFQHNLPAEETEALLNPANRATPNALSNLQQAEKRLKDEFTNGALADWLQGKRADINMDQLVRFLPNYKLSDVQDIMRRLSSDPELLEQWRRKTFQAILQEARRSPTPIDVLKMYQSQGKSADIVSGSAINKALGTGDQYEKYKTILGSDAFEMLQDIGKRELLREEKRRVGGGAGMLAKGDVATGFLNALTPGAGGKGSVLKDLNIWARDKVASVVLASPKLNSLLLAPHTLEQMPTVIGAIISSEPFIRGLLQEMKNPGTAYKTLATLKVAFGAPGQQPQAGQKLSDADLERKYSTPSTPP